MGRRAICAAVVLTVLSGGAAGVSKASEAGGTRLLAAPKPTAVSIVGDERTILQPGDVIYRGTPRGSTCVFDEGITLEGRGQLGVAYSLRVHVRPDCVLVFEKMRRIRVTPCDYEDPGSATNRLGVLFPLQTYIPRIPNEREGSPLDAVTDEIGALRYKGCVKYTILEQFGVTATELYHQQYFFRKANCDCRVWARTPPTGYYYHSSFPGWAATPCPGGCEYSPSGPSRIWVDGDAHFQNALPPRPNYTQYARWDAYASGTPFTYDCRLTQGSVPPSWDEHCDAESYPI